MNLLLAGVCVLFTSSVWATESIIVDVEPGLVRGAGFGELTPARHDLQIRLQAPSGYMFYNNVTAFDMTGMTIWDLDAPSSTTRVFTAYGAQEDEMGWISVTGTVFDSSNPMGWMTTPPFGVPVSNVRWPCAACPWENGMPVNPENCAAGYTCDITREGEVGVPVPCAVSTSVKIHHGLPGTLTIMGGSGGLEILKPDLTPFTSTYLASGGVHEVPLVLRADASFAGETTLTARFLQDGADLDSQDVLKVKPVQVQVAIKYPHGDPSVSATNWSDGSTDEANWSNEKTFSDAQPITGISICVVSCEATVQTNPPVAYCADALRWTIDDVGPIRAEWTNHVEGDPHTGKGLMTTAVFATSTGLPEDNSAFGSKTVTLTVEGLPGAGGTTTVEVFYPRGASNHSGGQPDSPNWFHYWMQARPNPDVVYVNQPIFGRVPGMTAWSYHVQPDKTRIEIGSSFPHAGRPYGVGEFTSGIDNLISAVIHEEKHVEQIADADALMPATSGGDSFRYGWSWNQTPHNHWNKGADAEWGVASVDDDANTTIDDAAPIPAFEPGNGDDVSLDHPSWVWWPNAWPVPPPFPLNPGLHPLEVQAIRHADDAMDEHDFWEHDWADPGKQHKTNLQWDD
jgi:hypothetical protein